MTKRAILSNPTRRRPRAEFLPFQSFYPLRGAVLSHTLPQGVALGYEQVGPSLTLFEKVYLYIIHKINCFSLRQATFDSLILDKKPFVYPRLLCRTRAALFVCDIIVFVGGVTHQVDHHFQNIVVSVQDDVNQ